MIPIQQKLAGTWRTYKLFCFSGKVQYHTTSSYTQLSIDEDDVLTMFSSDAKRHAISLKAGEWRIEFIKKRWFLYFGKRQAFELITVEANDLVLADLVKGDKIFFAKMPEWNLRIEPIITSVRHVRAELSQEVRKEENQ